MARLIKAKCRICRREGAQLFLRGSRCDSAKCSFKNNATPPGQHGAKNRRSSSYNVHLREKQKLKRMYGLMDQQFRRYFREAQVQEGDTGANLLICLECRLDNVLYQGCMGLSRNQSRQLISHGHTLVNGHKVNIVSYSVRAGDVIKPAANETSKAMFKNSLTNSGRKNQVPSWLKLSEEPMELQVVQLPKREDINVPINEQLVVEFSSR
jgi:small subunit ribosomal protein S4